MLQGRKKNVGGWVLPQQAHHPRLSGMQHVTGVRWRLLDFQVFNHLIRYVINPISLLSCTGNITRA